MSKEFETAKRSVRSGLEKGIFAGIEVNCYKGLAYSITADVEEAALHMFTNGVNIEFISDITGLSEERIQTLNADNFYHWARKNPLSALMYATDPEEVRAMGVDTESLSPIGAGIKVAIEIIDEELRNKSDSQGTEAWYEKGMETGMEQLALHMIKNHSDTDLIEDITGLSSERIWTLQAEYRRANSNW